MNYCPNPTRTFRKKWTLRDLSAQEKNSNFKKLKLLLWKNYKIQTRHKFQTVIELLLPLLFTLVLVIVRNIIKPTFVNEPTIFPALEIEHFPPYVVQTLCSDIYYSPNSPLIDSVMQKVKEKYFDQEGLRYNFTGFETEEDMHEAYNLAAKNLNAHSTLDYESTVPVLAGVAFDGDYKSDSFPSDIQYKLRFPASQRSSFDLISERFGIKPAWFTELIFPLIQLLGPRSKSQIGGGLPGYHEEGFLYLQYAVERTLTNMLLNDTQNPEAMDMADYNDQISVKVQRFPYPGYIDDKYLFALQAWLPLIMLLSFIYPVMNITKQIVYEKQIRLKESMKIMGLPNWLHWTAWFIKAASFLVTSVIIMTILIKTKFAKTQELAILTETNGFVILSVLLIFSYSMIGFCFFISSLFSTANSAATAAGICWFVFYVPYGFLQPRYNLLSLNVKVISCFLLNTPIAFVWQIVCMLEGIGAGLQWSNLFTGPSPDDSFTVGHCMIMMLVNGTVYILAAIYIEAIRPGDYGVPLPWYFVFTKWYWTGQLREDSKERKNIANGQTAEKSHLFENSKSNEPPGIQIQGLTKVFGNHIAVKNLNLSMYPNQVTALLGHNGAGKTTTMSMLTGLYAPTAGTAVMNGHDIRTNILAIRSSLGICPQHDVLFGELTVEEHLKFFSLLKGLNPLLLEGEINRMLIALGLEGKRHAQAATLSGGMKRKLSVGIALCAGSKIVLLDEPTSGMDPGARRSTWDLIQSEKKGRTIILSTHFMEEADLLGDRIAIMAHGEVQCCGSSLFLKKTYGGGYHLTIVKEHSTSVEKITKFLQDRIPEIETDQNVGLEISYSLPDEKANLFPKMFNELEEQKKELGISSYGASITTMEEVFIRVGREAETALSDLKQMGDNENLKMLKSLSKMEDHTDGFLNQTTKRNKGLTLKLQQFRAMITKKWIYTLRKHILLIFQLGIPIFYLDLVLIILSSLPGLLDPPPHFLTLKRYENLGKTVTPFRCEDTNILCDSYQSMMKENGYDLEEVPSTLPFVEYMIEKSHDDLVLVNTKYMVGFEERVPNATADALMMMSQLDPEFFNFNDTMYDYPIAYNETQEVVYEDYPINNDTTKFEAIGFFNNQPFHTPPLSLNLITNALLRAANYTLSLTNHPFPYNVVDSIKQIGSLYTVGFQVGYNMALGMSFLASSVIVFLIEERELRAKHLQFVSGVEFILFWTACFLVDFFNYCVACVGVCVTLLIFGVDDFFSVQMQSYLALLLFCYGLAVIPFMYLWSFAFTIPTSGYTRMSMFNLFTGIATMLSVAIVQIPELDLGEVATLLNKIFLIFPNYALGMGVVQLSSNYQLKQQCSSFNLEFLCPAFPKSFCCAKLKEDYLDWEQSGIGRNIVYLAISFVIYSSILFLYESRIVYKVANLFKGVKTKGKVADLGDMEDDDISADDSDVYAEAQKIQNTDLQTLLSTHTLLLRNLIKQYSGFVAVDHLNLGVLPGECFGLLGVNGAGKTTTFKMLTGDLSPTNGDAFIQGFSVRNNLKQVHENVGYCPQFDALIEEMTGRETITMYARLRGIPESEIEGLVLSLSQKLVFSAYIDNNVKSYSGGNKRKLSTAVALIGNPPVVFLDEPTTGMDPVARRCLWNVISEVRDNGTSVVLTSHSMEECEALCTRLAIMVNGKFRCLGTPQELKYKFGEGYTLIAQTPPRGLDSDVPFTRAKQELARRRSSSIRIRQTRSPQAWEAALEDLRNFVETNFPGAMIKDIHPGFIHYHINNKSITWGTMFEKMEIAKERFKLEAYSVGQTSLEQVFLNFSKLQTNSGGDEQRPHKIILLFRELFGVCLSLVKK